MLRSLYLRLSLDCDIADSHDLGDPVAVLLRFENQLRDEFRPVFFDPAQPEEFPGV